MIKNYTTLSKRIWSVKNLVSSNKLNHVKYCNINHFQKCTHIKLISLLGL